MGGGVGVVLWQRVVAAAQRLGSVGVTLVDMSLGLLDLSAASLALVLAVVLVVVRVESLGEIGAITALATSLEVV